MAASDNKYPSPDIYNVNDFVNAVKKQYITGVGEDTLMLGTFGYFGQIMSDMFQNTIIMASEFSNESIATKAKFEKNIIAHALGLGITDINAVPAKMNVLLSFNEEDIIKWANARTANGDELPWTFVFDKNNKIYFGSYEFHPDYDIIIKKVEVITQGSKKKFAYTAQYDPKDFAVKNPVSDVTNPYLSPPVKVNMGSYNAIFVACEIRQVEREVQYTKILADNDIASKTITFQFSGQLAAFSLDITEGNETYHMIPVYEGLNVDTRGQFYFWYTYLNSNTIRIKFDKVSKIPKVNASVQINIQTTQGSKGNFNFQSNDFPIFTFESERLDYSNIYCQVRPVDGNASYGSDKKTIEELKQIIPKEALSRGSITNRTDLENHFNILNTEYSKLFFFKKRDNCLERLYYSFIILRNDRNIIPTNTIDISLTSEDLFTEDDSGKLVLKQGQLIVLSPGEQEAKLYHEGDILPDHNGEVYDDSFAYYLPYNFIINRSPLYGMYTLTTIHDTKLLDFSYINESCLYQYIATSINWDRDCLDDHNTYKLSIDVKQNIIYNDYEDNKTISPIQIDEEGNITCNVYAYLVLYNEENAPLRWAKAEIAGYDIGDSVIHYEFKFTTEDYIDKENKIRIDTGLYDIGSNYESYAHLNDNMTTRIFIVSKQEESYGLGDPDLSTIIPGLDGLSLSNTYTVVGGINFFYDYSEIVSSTVVLTDDLVVVPPPDPDPTPEKPDQPKPNPLLKEQIRADIDFLYAMEIINDAEIDVYHLGLLYYSKYWNVNRIKALYAAEKLTDEEVEDILKNAVNIPKPPVINPPDNPDNPDKPDKPEDPSNPDYYPPGFDPDDPSTTDREKDEQFTGEIKKSITEKIPEYLEKILNAITNEDDNNEESSNAIETISNTDNTVSKSKARIMTHNETTPVDPTIYYSPEKARSDLDFIYSLRVSDDDVDVYGLANKYYPIYWDSYRIESLMLAGILTQDEGDSILGYKGDGSDRPLPEINNASEKEIRSDLDFIYALDIIQDPDNNAYELTKSHRPDEWSDKRVESLYLLDKLTKDQVIYLLGYAPPKPGDPDTDPDNPDEPFVPEPVYRHVTTYHLKSVPVVKYNYFTDEEVAKAFFKELVSRKSYIEDAVNRLEDAFEMDFKFFNTYGPSKFFTWDNGTDVVDRVNINLFFKLKLKPNYDTNIVDDIKRDIKNYIEDINNINSLHIPNLITQITNTYRASIEYFEFVSINGKEASYQHIYAMDMPDGIMVPEFVNINTLPDEIPDIIIELV